MNIFYFDWEFDFLYFLQGFRNPILDNLMAILSDIGNAGLIWIAIAVILLCMKKYRISSLQLIVAMIFTFIIGNLILKNLVDRARPCQIDEAINLIVNIPKDSSFPSGHTMNGITAALTLWFIDKRFGIPAMILALGIAFSRMYNFMHFPTDIIAGIIVGVTSAVVCNCFFKKYVYNNKKEVS